MKKVISCFHKNVIIFHILLLPVKEEMIAIIEKNK